MSDVEIAVGIKDILRILGWSQRKFYYHKKELVELGLVFKRNEGRPPKKRTYAFPSRLQRYTAEKGRMGEPI